MIIVLMYKFHYFYKITNLLNNHFYYGVHNTNKLEDGYMGSGRRLKIAIEKYGICNFRKEILKFFNSEEEAYQYESEMVNETLVNSYDCYNIALGGKRPKTKNLVAVIDDNNLSISIQLEEYKKNKDLYKTSWKDKHHTKEQKNSVRQKMTPVNSTNDRVWVTNMKGTVKYIRKELLDEFLSNGFELGRTGYKPRKNAQGKEIKI